MDQAERLREMVRSKTDEIADAIASRDADRSSAGNAPWVISVTSGKGGSVKPTLWEIWRYLSSERGKKCSCLMRTWVWQILISFSEFIRRIILTP